MVICNRCGLGHNFMRRLYPYEQDPCSEDICRNCGRTRGWHYNTYCTRLNSDNKFSLQRDDIPDYMLVDEGL